MPLGLERRGTNGERRRGSCRHRLKRTVAERVGGEKRIRVTFRLSLIGSYPPISTIEFENVLGKFLIPSSIVFFYHVPNNPSICLKKDRRLEYTILDLYFD